ncbi:hypothetical protein sos41_28780 [Alphaproteobacteria bacterium SO-S41]|nr:hypothetical protein sos41_28780 [Alphaproteobacteria bacterium SO-S41]
MFEFVVTPIGATVKYTPDIQGPAWIKSELSKHGSITISRVFSFLADDVVSEPDGDPFEENAEYEFRFATIIGEYLKIEGRIFGIIPNIFLHKNIPLSRKLFAAERNVSIFLRISKILNSTDDIIIGGDHPSAIPYAEFENLLKKFPNTLELDRYANARVADILGDYLDNMKDARRVYEDYLSKTRAFIKENPLRQEELLHLEVHKYKLIRKTITGWLTSGANRSESDWQNMILQFILLIFPKYVAVLRNVKINDYYTSPGSVHHRYIDIALIDASGNIDLIEIKKPTLDMLLGKTIYRGNSVPSRVLTYTVMQAEKYLFHLNKWGIKGEELLTKKYRSALPSDLKIRITSPKSIVILGRDRLPSGDPAFDENQGFDFDVIKRKYSNLIDIMSYDDLLRRLDNIIASLETRAEG